MYTDDIKEDDMVDPFADTSIGLVVTFRKANGELEAAFHSGSGGLNVTEVVNDPV